MPLGSGPTTVSLVMTDAAGNADDPAITVYRSPVAVTVNAVDLAIYAGATATVTGTVGGGVSALRVNGVVATIAGSAWSAAGVPINYAGTVAVRVSGYPT